MGYTHSQEDLMTRMRTTYSIAIALDKLSHEKVDSDIVDEIFEAMDLNQVSL